MNRTSMNEIGGIVASARSRRWRMLVGGELVDAADGATYESVDPSSEQRIAEVPAATVADVDVAVAAARSAALEWRRVAPRERAAIVRRCADILLEHREELAVLDALDSGNPVRAMRIDVDIAADLMRLYADWALELKGETIPATADHLHYTVREPYGVVARIVPYNHPLMFAAGRSAAPLVAGNSVVLKAPDQTPLTALRMGELFADVLPAGTLTVLTGQGAASGDALVRHPDVRRIAFIGSVPTGRAIQLAAAEAGIKVVTLELRRQESAGRLRRCRAGGGGPSRRRRPQPQLDRRSVVWLDIPAPRPRIDRRRRWSSASERSRARSGSGRRSTRRRRWARCLEVPARQGHVVCGARRQ